MNESIYECVIPILCMPDGRAVCMQNFALANWRTQAVKTEKEREGASRQEAQRFVINIGIEARIHVAQLVHKYSIRSFAKPQKQVNVHATLVYTIAN